MVGCAAHEIVHALLVDFRLPCTALAGYDQRLVRPSLAHLHVSNGDGDGALTMATPTMAILTTGLHVGCLCHGEGVRRPLRVTWGEALAICHELGCVELGDVLEGIDGHEDGADVGVDVITQVAHARVVQQGGIRQVQQRSVVALVYVGRVGREVRVCLELIAFGSHDLRPRGWGARQAVRTRCATSERRTEM